MEFDFGKDAIDTRKSLTVIALILYAVLYVYIYIQLILVVYYGHKRWCYRTAVLYTSIFWAILRVTLFSYYCYLEHIHDKEGIPELSRRVGTTSYFILFSLPLYLEFCILSLMVGYFSQLLRTSEDRYNPTSHRVGKCLVYANIFVFLLNLICAIFIKIGEKEIVVHQDSNPDEAVTPTSILNQFPSFVTYVVYFRVTVNGIAFIGLSLYLAYIIYSVARNVEVQLLLETEDMTETGSCGVGTALVILYVFRTIINVLALIPKVGWFYDTDQVDLLSDSEYGYFMFMAFLFLWEYLPTMMSVVFFRVKKPILNMNYPPISIIYDGPEIDDLSNSNPLECSMTFNQASSTHSSLSTEVTNPLLRGSQYSRTNSPSHSSLRAHYGAQLVM